MVAFTRPPVRPRLPGSLSASGRNDVSPGTPGKDKSETSVRGIYLSLARLPLKHLFVSTALVVARGSTGQGGNTLRTVLQAPDTYIRTQASRASSIRNLAAKQAWHTLQAVHIGSDFRRGRCDVGCRRNVARGQIAVASGEARTGCADAVRRAGPRDDALVPGPRVRLWTPGG